MHLRYRSTLWLAIASITMTMSSMTTTSHAADDSQLLSPEKMLDLRRLGESAVSPDGKQLAYLVSDYNLAENDSVNTLYLGTLPDSIAKPNDRRPETAAAFGTEQVRLLDSKALLSNVKGLNSIGWLERNGQLQLLYIAPGKNSPEESQAGETSSNAEPAIDKSEASGDPQIWVLDVESGTTKQLSDIKDGVANLKIAPTGKHVAFTLDVKLDPTVNELYKDLPKADARIIDSLMYRHWNQWHDYKYSHVHIASLSQDNELGDPRDLMENLRADCPLPPFGGSEHFNFSPDGTEIALTIKLVNNPAVSTDSSIFLTPVETDGGLVNIVPGMPGYDTEATYSPDGRWIAFQSMRRGGFEADRNRIFLYDRQEESSAELTVGLDQTTHAATWSNDSKSIYFDSEYAGTQQAYEITISDRRIRQLSRGPFDFHIRSRLPGRDMILVTQSSMLRPNELALIATNATVADQDTTIATLTDLNDELIAGMTLPSVSERWVTATDGKKIHNWVITPPNFDAAKTYPLLVYCQGGPQGQIGQSFSFRWNFHLMASQGYVVIAVNRRGLPGFGREWNDQISGDWGGQAMQDILAATDSMLTEPYVDTSRVGAVGASFGGYTVYWLMGNAENRFAAMIAHCGVFNLESMYGATEELFFVDWDLGGAYWKSQATQKKYDLFSPHRYVGNWKTPLLVIHGEKDFRVPVTQGMEAFTAAQLQGVESRFLYFPEEGHWISKPQNGVLWARVFYQWLDQHLGE
jgi:dipeptidyl aminopeptidase/acylaminoacyl peptidase